MKALRTALLATLLWAVVGCMPPAVTIRGTPAELSALRSNGDKSFSAGDVITWAQLDDHFRDQTVKLAVGEADGKALLGRLVLLENAAEAAAFLQAHGCAQVSGPIGVRKLPTALQVDVELTGKDGQKLILILTSDGTPAGEG
jgi:hypothetical protein